MTDLERDQPLDPPPPHPNSKLRGYFHELLIRMVPVGIGAGAFFLAAITKTNNSGLKDLLQFTVALLAGVTAYTVTNEIFLRRLPRQIKTEMSALVDNLDVLNAEIVALDGELAKQLVVIESLKQFQTVAFDVSEALTHARAMQQKASQSVWAMWTQHQYDQSLKTYFADTLANRVYTLRVVDAKTVHIDELIDHVTQSWVYLTSGTYEIYVARQVEFEAMVVDHDEAGLFLYPHGGGFGCCYIGSGDRRFVTVGEGLFDRLRDPQSLLPIPKHLLEPSEEALSQVRVWLQKFYAP